MFGPPKQNEFESEAGPAICQNIAGALSINDVSVRARVLTFKLCIQGTWLIMADLSIPSIALPLAHFSLLELL